VGWCYFVTVEFFVKDLWAKWLGTVWDSNIPFCDLSKDTTRFYHG